MPNGFTKRRNYEMKIAFRVDASIDIGTGHVYRCLTLAKRLHDLNHHCVFVCKDHVSNLIEFIQKASFEVKVINSQTQPQHFDSIEIKLAHSCWLQGSQIEDAESFIALFSNTDFPEMVIVDHYALDSVWENKLKDAFNPILMVIDDLCDRKHNCDFLLDQTFSRNAEEYASFVNSDTSLLLGTKYSLLRDEFLKLRNNALRKRRATINPKKLIITMGGVDQNNFSLKFINLLYFANLLDKFSVTLVIGAQSPFKDSLIKCCNQLNVNVIINANNMSELMLENDVAIGAMGGTTWERSVLALPTLNIEIADNQSDIAQRLSRIGILTSKAYDIDVHQLEVYLNKIVSDYQNYVSLVANICDGLGVERVIQHLFPINNKIDENITLLLAQNDDIKFIFDLQQQPETRRYARNKNVPVWAEHEKWMAQKIEDPNCYFYIIHCEESKVGSLRIDKIADYSNNRTYEISIFVDPVYFGKSIASAALKRLLFLHRNKDFLATVLEGNQASHGLFKKLGFDKQSETQYFHKGIYDC